MPVSGTFKPGVLGSTPSRVTIHTLVEYSSF
jgi:hypothetical protein